MMQAIILTPDEWFAISDVVVAAKAILKSSDDGGLKGAINREEEPGKALAYLLRDLNAATMALPDDLDIITRADAQS